MKNHLFKKLYLFKEVKYILCEKILVVLLVTTSTKKYTIFI